MNEEWVPGWATGTTDGKLVLGAQLSTKDGRRVGNAHIILVGPSRWEPDVTVYTVLTDAGNEMILLSSEIAEMFHPPRYVSDVAEVIKRFKRDE